MLEQQGEHVFLQVRHFDRGLLAWEEKEAPHEFVLVELNERGDVFFELDKPEPRWSVYRREDPDRLIAYFTHATEPDPALLMASYAPIR